MDNIKYFEKEGVKSSDGMNASEIKQGYSDLTDLEFRTFNQNGESDQQRVWMEDSNTGYGFLGYRNTNGRQR